VVEYTLSILKEIFPLPDISHLSLKGEMQGYDEDDEDAQQEPLIYCSLKSPVLWSFNSANCPPSKPPCRHQPQNKRKALDDREMVVLKSKPAASMSEIKSKPVTEMLEVDLELLAKYLFALGNWYRKSHCHDPRHNTRHERGNL